MKIAALVILWGWLATASAWAQQVCPPGILQTTPTDDFVDHGDGTVTHNPTGLMWKQCLEGLSGVGCATGTVTTHTWQAALQLADGHSFAAYSDWRLPNIKELSSIVERSCYGPSINLGVFPNDSASFVWSGSPFAPRTDASWVLNFNDGNFVYWFRHNEVRVRLVRGPQ